MRPEVAAGEEPVQNLQVYPPGAFTAIDGANLGDCMGVADDLALGDVYRLRSGAEPRELALAFPQRAAHPVVARLTSAGAPGAQMRLDCCATFMSRDGTLLDILVLVEQPHADGSAARIHLYPLADLAPRTPYALVTIDRHIARARFAEAACASFTRGTHITMADGRQVEIERLRAGDPVLTRDHGPQPIRWIGQKTVRAHGAFAPIRIARGALNNARDLIVSPNHRLFVYQRRDRLLTHRAEVLVKARNLLNGTSVTRTEGGFVDYFPVLFDRHEIIYAEGIAAETLLVDMRTRPALPGDTSFDHVAALYRAPAVELSDGQIDAALAADLLRRSSVG